MLWIFDYPLLVLLIILGLLILLAIFHFIGQNPLPPIGTPMRMRTSDHTRTLDHIC